MAGLKGSRFYVQVFSASIFKRIELIRELSRLKASIDEKLMQGSDLSSSEISKLLQIIGRDIFFKKAESRHKNTLRHLCWKILKSIARFQRIYQEQFVKKMAKQVMRELSFWKELIYEDMDIISRFIEKRDKLYEEEAKVLEKILTGEENINAYKSLLQKEREIGIEARGSILKIKSHIIDFLTFVSEFFKAWKRGNLKLIGPISKTSFLLIMYIASFTLIGAGLYEMDISDEDLVGKLLALTGFCGFISSLIVNVKELKELRKFDKYFYSRMDI